MSEEIAFYNNQYNNQPRGRPSNNRYQPYNDNMTRSTHLRLCYGCGQSDHWIKDCPDIKLAIQQLHSNPVLNNSKKPSTQNSTYLCKDETEIVSPVVKDSEVKKKVMKKTEKRVPIFFSQCDTMEYGTLVTETASKAVLDNAASVTVCGQDWYDNFANVELSPDAQQEVMESASDTTFVFGAGEVKASKVVSIPVDICGKKLDLEAHVVNADIPMLLSSDVIKGLGMSVDLLIFRRTL